MKRTKYSKTIICNSENNNNETIEEIHQQQDDELNKNISFGDYIFEKSYDIVIISFSYLYKTIKFFIRVSGIYLLWIFLHYIASHLYIKICVPSTIIGFLMSPFMTATPHCQGLRWIVYNAAGVINNMWIILGAWICSTILIIKSETVNDNQL
jgi:hypothetical protein